MIAGGNHTIAHSWQGCRVGTDSPYNLQRAALTDEDYRSMMNKKLTSKGITMNSNHTYNKKLKPNAQALRKNMTEEERILWYQFLKNLPVHFYRQRIIGCYIVDFYCPSAKLVIELDGSQHFSEDGVRNDAKRDAFLRENGLTVLRIPNNEIHRNLRGVADLILQHLPQDHV